MKNLILETNWGKDFNGVAKEAKEKATEKRHVEFEFNGIDCIVSPSTNLCNLLRDYHNAFTMGWKKIGPDCADKYSKEMEKELKIKEDEAERKVQERSRQYKIEAEEKEIAFRNKINGVEFECSDDENFRGWEKSNKDGYGGRIISYAKEWAMLMQVDMANGKKLKDIAQQASHEADYDGITGFMYGAAVQMLSQCWKHGEELRKWHNKKYNQEGDGVVNPAILTIGGK